MQTLDIITMLEKMAENGQPPSEGCNLFGVGYEDAFQRLKDKYLIERFGRGSSAEKFVVGPFGSGKTLFIRQLLELAFELGCVTSEISLNKNLDFTKSLLVYREIVRELRAPNGTEHGMRELLLASIERIRGIASDPSTKEPLVQAWVAGLDKADFKLKAFGKILRRTLLAHLSNDEITFDYGSRWLSGEFADPMLSRELSVDKISKAEENLFSERALLSLYQFIKHAKFQGTVIGLDEAEQGLTADKKKMTLILSMMQSDINQIVRLENGAALVVYALTPDIVETMENLPSLQGRLANPGDRGFFDGEILAPKIDLSRRGDTVQELQAIGHRLVEVFFKYSPKTISVRRGDVLIAVDEIAVNVDLPPIVIPVVTS